MCVCVCVCVCVHYTYFRINSGYFATWHSMVVCIMETQCVFPDVETGYLYIIWMNIRLERVKHNSQVSLLLPSGVGIFYCYYNGVCRYKTGQAHYHALNSRSVLTRACH